jgi:MFS family permease
MDYLAELRRHWRPLLAATLGLGTGNSFSTYHQAIMGPHLIAEFGWSRAEFAAVGTLALLTVFAFPIIGRITDVIGVRRTAAIGVASLPISFGLLSMMTGDIREYMALFIFQGSISVMTTTTVYSRIVVQHISKARGLALAIAASGPALMGAIFHPQLNTLVEEWGWRQGYVALAIFTGVMGVIALLIMPAERKSAQSSNTRPGSMREDYPKIFRTPAFWILGGAMLLVNLPQTIALTQLTIFL